MLFVTISFFLAHEFAGEELRHIVELGAGLLVVCVGASLLYSALKRARSDQHSSQCCSCSCTEKQTSTLSKHVPVIGFLIGLVPCPSALAVSLSATKVGSLSQAIFLSLTFAFGVAVTLSTLGIIFTHSADRIEALVPRLERFKPYIPLISPIMVVLLGVVMIGHGVVH
jgi:ABC-type nickel/cobalt efflux system permease component RcnA